MDILAGKSSTRTVDAEHISGITANQRYKLDILAACTNPAHINGMLDILAKADYIPSQVPATCRTSSPAENIPA